MLKCNTNTLTKYAQDETIHITIGCIVHLRDHWNKVVPLMKPSLYLRILVMALSFVTTHAS
jgi:hypothetical protein